MASEKLLRAPLNFPPWEFNQKMYKGGFIWKLSPLSKSCNLPNRLLFPKGLVRPRATRAALQFMMDKKELMPQGCKDHKYAYTKTSLN